MKDLDIRPVGDLIVIKVITEEDEASKGIILFDEYKKTPKSLVIYALGDELDDAKGLKIGDTVILNKNAQHSVTVHQDYIIASINDIIAIINKD